jgi:hypothetical protein
MSGDLNDLFLRNPEDVKRMDQSVYDRVQAFMADVEAACAKHGISISHEDCHGAFILVPFDERENLRGAIVAAALNGGK